MCGIAGIYTLNSAQVPTQEQVKSMVGNFIYRGPDEEGFHVDKDSGLALGFRRLALIDLTGGHQPLSNEDGTVVLICNGEIYNYRELRESLRAQGHIFTTQCDVEVLVHLYEEYGTDLLSRLNGQFAFALFDKKRQRLFLARDHVGISPLFYAITDGLLLFASEIKALLQHPAVQRTVNLQALDQIVTFPGMISPHTMFEGIQSLKPGYYLSAANGDLSVQEYWDIEYPLADAVDTEMSESEAVEMLDEQLRRAVSYRLHADVPVGFYLSGGLDSSLLAGLIHTLSPHEKRHSFSIGFTEDAIDERKYQHLMARHVQSEHHEILFAWQEISRRLETAVYHAEAPLKESYNTCSLALSELVHNTGLKVVLTGEGADELFGGYVGYRLDQESREHDSASGLEALLEQELQEELWGEPFFYEKNYYAFQEVKSALYAEPALARLQALEPTGSGLINTAKLRGRSRLHKRSYLDCKLRLADHLLADHGDRVLYANSVEGRYPFLDINVLACVQKIPPGLLVRGMEEKYVLKRLAQRYIPREVIQREKFGFVAPASTYLLRQDIEWIQDLLSYERIQRMGYFNPDTVERLKTMYLQKGFSLNQTFDDDFLMIVLTFSLFLDLFQMPSL